MGTAAAMTTKLLLLSLLLLLNSLLPADATEQPLTLAIGGRPWFGFTGAHFERPSAAPSGFSSSNGGAKPAINLDKYFTQTLAHFNTSSKATFKQRYFVNAAFSAKSGAHILYVEADGPASAAHVTDESFPHVAAAKSNKATVWALEHRFYGKSRPGRPFDTLKVGALQLLSSAQAVEDIAAFIRAQNLASGEKSPKWVLVGGSYAGALALWTRAKYPALIAGVVSSSAPAAPAFDFYGYQFNVDNAYLAKSRACYDAIASALQAVRDALQNEAGRTRLSTDLKLTPAFDQLALTAKDLQNFNNIIASLFQIPVQFNRVNIGPFANAAGIDDICRLMTVPSTSDDIGRVVSVASYLSTALVGSFTGLANSYPKLVADLIAATNATASDADAKAASARNWVWQQCNEFGFFPTTDYGRGLFTASIPNNFFLDICVDVFGAHFDVDHTKRAVRRTQHAYPTAVSGGVYTGTNAVIINGGLDPWRTLGIQSAPDKSSIVYVAEGVGHVADLQPPTANDTFALKFARNLATNKLKSWLATSANAAAAAKTAEIEEGGAIVDAKSDEGAGKWREPKAWKSEVALKIQRPAAHKHRHSSKRRGESLYSLGAGLSFQKQLRRELEKRRRLQQKEKVQQTINGGNITNHFLEYGFVRQPLDHFDAGNTESFKQYFIYNNDYIKGADAPHFLMLGGEAPLDTSLVDDNLYYLHIAKKVGAVAYALEHRYYGASQPKADVATANLTWLTTEQALADAAQFIRTINAEYKLTNPRWVIFGGSYPGNLAAWFRLRYPTLSLGAIASSAPVQSKTDFFEYMQVVQNSTIDFGGKSCRKAVHNFFLWLQQHLTTIDGRKKISEDFGLCDAWDENAIAEKDAAVLQAIFVYDLAGFVQYDSSDHEYVKYICETFKETDDDLDADGSTAHIETQQKKAGRHHRLGAHLLRRLHEHRRHQRSRRGHQRRNKAAAVAPQLGGGNNKPDDGSSSGGGDYSGGSGGSDGGDYPGSSSSGSPECSDLSYAGLLEEYNLVDYNEFDTSDRCWTYQACTEWGYHQSTNFGYNLFESAIPVNFDIDLCTDVFGAEYNRSATDAGVRASNALYGGQENYNGTNVVFVNGSEDPWHVLSVTASDPARGITAILIDGTSHCYDMYGPNDLDPKPLKHARKQIRAIVTAWLEAAKS